MASSTSTTPAPKDSFLDRYFDITRRGSTVGREVRGGLVTFFTMAYIIALNPIIIGTKADHNGLLINGALESAPGAAVSSIGAVAAATALVAGIMTILMGVVGRYPLALAAGLGINAIVAYVLVGAMGMTWPQAMGVVFWEGVLITVLVLTGFRQAVFRAVPRSMRVGIAVGIGLFIAFVGLVDAGVVRRPESPTAPPVELGISGSLMGWPMLVFVIGLVLVAILYALKVRGAMLISILATTVLAVIVEAVAHLGPRIGSDGKIANNTGWMQNVPALESVVALPDLSILGRVDPIGVFTAHGGLGGVLAVLLTIFSLLLADFFDTMGTVVAIGAEGDLLDADGNPPRTTEILLVDSLAAVAGGLGSTSSNTSYIESAAGVGEGARTGLASVVTGLAFLASIFLSPLVGVVPSEAATPVLVFVGFLMMAQVTGVDWDDVEEGLPAFLTIALMPFTYSITTGIGAGFITYVLMKVARGRARNIHPLMWVVAAMFVVYFVQGLLQKLL